MKTKFYICVLSLCLQLYVGLAHDVVVHRAITENAAASARTYSSAYRDFFDAVSPNYGDKIAVDSMKNGSAREDDKDTDGDGGGKRSYNHFYDPLTGLGMSDFPPDKRVMMGTNSFTWAAISNCPGLDVNPRVLGIPVPKIDKQVENRNTFNHWSWQNARGYLYIVDSGNDRITIASGETILGTSGGTGTALGEFQGAVNLGVGARGIYVGETSNQRVQVFEPLKNINGTPPTPLHERLALSGQFSPALSQPRAIAPIRDLLAERMYIADAGNNRLIKVTLPETSVPDGVWATMTTNLITNDDFAAALAPFSNASRDSYHEAFLRIGLTKAKADLDAIGTLTPVFIDGDKAQYYFERTIEGQPVLFPVEFVKENGTWKIQGF